MKRIARSALVEHSAEQLYRLVENIEAYPKFLPWCIGVEVSRQPGLTHARMTVGMAGLRQSFTTENRNVPGESIDLRLLEGPFRSFNAAWRFSALDASACKIEYSMEYEFASAALAAVLEPLFGRIADTMVDAFTRRAAEVYGQDPR
jgi:ribosome-associated toxin RatA of RatAB toxin-antitoxin module